MFSLFATCEGGKKMEAVAIATTLGRCHTEGKGCRIYKKNDGYVSLVHDGDFNVFSNWLQGNTPEGNRVSIPLCDISRVELLD